MPAYDNPHSQFVALAKVLLPLAALALLATLFLFDRSPATEPEIPYADIEEIAREPRLSEAAYRGVAPNGSVISIRLKEMRPRQDAPDVFSATGLRAEVETPEGRRIEIAAGTGEVDRKDQSARIEDFARVVTSDGYQMETEGLTADLKQGIVRSIGPLEVQTPFGKLRAGSVQIGGEDEPERMDFADGVRLLYIPPEEGSSEP